MHKHYFIQYITLSFDFRVKCDFTSVYSDAHGSYTHCRVVCVCVC